MFPCKPISWIDERDTHYTMITLFSQYLTKKKIQIDTFWHTITIWHSEECPLKDIYICFCSVDIPNNVKYVQIIKWYVLKQIYKSLQRSFNSEILSIALKCPSKNTFCTLIHIKMLTCYNQNVYRIISSDLQVREQIVSRFCSSILIRYSKRNNF